MQRKILGKLEQPGAHDSVKKGQFVKDFLFLLHEFSQTIKRLIKTALLW